MAPLTPASRLFARSHAAHTGGSDIQLTGIIVP